MIAMRALAAFAGLALSLGSTPALANETAAAAQISAIPTNAAAATGDAEFSELFASWEAFDGDGAVQIGQAPAFVAKVSVPSRMPVEGVQLSSSYGMRTHPVLGGRRDHKGVDLAGATGTPVYATADGYVSKAEPFSSYGNYIQIEHGSDLQTRYAHLSGYAVAGGQQVVKGQLIGFIGSTGRSTGPHLHYEVRVAGEAVDPRPYMVTQLALAPEGTGGVGGPE